MTLIGKKFSWSLPVAGVVVAPLAAIPQEAACAIVGAMEWIGNENVIALLAATNALTIVP